MPASKTTVDFVFKVMRPLLKVMDPEVIGLEHVSGDRPSLYVGNHTTLGVLDIPFLAALLAERRGIYLRGLGDRAHFKVPVWGQMLSKIGAVEGSREACGALMKERQHILVFPGGAREVMKRKGERYKLIWKQRVGFAKMAIEHGYPIVPFAAVGAEECYDIIYDANDLARSAVGGLLGRLGVNFERLPPLVRGWGWTPLPRPVRFSFWFGEPIETRIYAERNDEDSCWALRRRTEAAVEAGIKALLLARGETPQGA